ncbi:MAG: protein-tyrosine phosphatase family protein [Pontiella sp.]
MPLFREVKLNLPGSLYLHSMPGRLEPFPDCCRALVEASIHRIICLNRQAEISEKSPEYAQAIRQDTLPAEWIHFPIGNWGVPEDEAAFLQLAKDSADRLNAGENILVHCKGGIGRTGTLASCMVAALNQPLSLVADAGGKAETEQQRALIASL